MTVAPLQIHTSYSLLQYPNTVEQWLSAAHERGYRAFPITDDDVLYGAIKFYQLAKKYQIKPLIGVTLHVLEGELIVFAEDNLGFRHLNWLSSRKKTLSANETLSVDQLTDHFEHVVILYDDQNDILHTQFKNYPAAYSFASAGLQPIDYIDATDQATLEVMRAIDEGAIISSPADLSSKQGDNWLKKQSDFQADLTPEQQTVNAEIIDRINLEIDFNQTQLPHFDLPNEFNTSTDYLRDRATVGLQARLKHHPEALAQYTQRLNYELKVISELGFDDYFLIIWDVLNFAHHQDIQTGPGRGSAAGSLVAWALYITDVDPIQYDLLFERFLNPDRAQMPDIDVDVPDDKREQILNYVAEKYGHRHVAQIVTFSTLAARQALRDTARVFGASVADQNKLGKTINRQLNTTLAANETPATQAVLKTIPNGELIFAMAKRIEGLPRQAGTHAAGVVIGAQPLVDILPVQNGNEYRLLTQFSMYYVEQLGLLKMDFLGLRNLTLLANTLRLVKERFDEPIHINRINLNDPDTLALFARADTNGVFQFESNGIKRVLRAIQPNSFEDIASVVALYRPGPMQNIDHFVARKNGQEAIQYPDPILEPILKSTYGVMIYQEQVMRVAEQFAGFTLVQADQLRYAMSKKRADQIETLRQLFIDGSTKKGHTAQQAEAVYQLIETFADYGFNRSHAVAYAKMAFELAYLKVHYPTAFFASVMNNAIGNDEKIRTYLVEAKAHQVNVLGPDVNESQLNFTVDQTHNIRFGFSQVKGLRSDFLRDLLNERTANGRFTTIQNFVARLPINRRKTDYLQTLIDAGALDHFGYNRAELTEALPQLISGAELGLDILGETKIKPLDAWSLKERLNRERAVLGVGLSGHPTENYHQKQDVLIAQTQVNQSVEMTLLVDDIKVIKTKKGDEMAFITAEDESGQISLTAFPNIYQTFANQKIIDKLIHIQGKTENRNGLQVILDQINIMSDV